MTEELNDLQATPSALPIAPGQLIGERYLVGEVLGGGGMGVVCAGTHVHLGTPVAIKLIHSELKDDAEAVQRFVNEARATAALKGEHIARVFDVGLLQTGEPYLVMEQLEGIGLDQYLRERGPLAPSEAVDIVLQVCEGLAEAHAAALVHRDIKPPNLFLARRPDGQYSVKILDFGIAKQRVHAESPALTDPGKSLGSPWYMSPEQMLTPASVDERADVWSLGVLLFELLTTRRPFDGESVPQVCANVLTATPPRPSDCRSDLAPELDEIVLGCLEKEPQRRPRSVSELAQALVPFASAPLPATVIALDDSRQSNPEPVAYAPRRPPSYGSLTPLHTGLRESGAYLPLRRRSWPLALPLVALALLLFGGWLQYRDPTLVPRAARALRTTHLALPWDPRLASDDPAPVLAPVVEAPTMLQSVHSGRALPEIARPELSPHGTVALTPEQVRARVENYEAWLRAQGLKRLNEAEP